MRRKLTDLIQYAIKKEYISFVHADNASFYRSKGYLFKWEDNGYKVIEK